VFLTLRGYKNTNLALVWKLTIVQIHTVDKLFILFLWLCLFWMFIFLRRKHCLCNERHVIVLSENFVACPFGHSLCWICQNLRQLFRIYHDIDIHPEMIEEFNPLNPELNPICYLLALLGAPHFLHVSRIRLKLLTFRLLMSYIYGAPILDVSRSHTTTQHSR